MYFSLTREPHKVSANGQGELWQIVQNKEMASVGNRLGIRKDLIKTRGYICLNSPQEMKARGSQWDYQSFITYRSQTHESCVVKRFNTIVQYIVIVL